MSLIAELLPPSNVVINLDASSKKRVFEQAGLLFENNQGIGRAILETCEAEAKSAGFRSAEMMATLPGVPLYSVCGYEGDESVQIPIGEGKHIECIRMSKDIG